MCLDVGFWHPPSLTVVASLPKILHCVSLTMRRKIVRRRFAKRAMEQWALNSQGTIAFCLRTMRKTALFFLHVLLFATWYILDVSRLLGLTLRPSAPVCCCHQDSLTRWRLALAQEAARDASSSSSPFVLLNHDVPCKF